MFKITISSSVYKFCFPKSPPQLFILRSESDYKGKNYYELLDINPNASQDEVKDAYIKLSKLHHPDASSDPNSIEIFNAVTTAYKVLKDPKKRIIYDSKAMRIGQDAKSVLGPLDLSESGVDKYSHGKHVRHPDHLMRMKTKAVKKGLTTFNDVGQFKDRKYTELMYRKTSSNFGDVLEKKAAEHKEEQDSQGTGRTLGVAMVATLAVLIFGVHLYADPDVQRFLKKHNLIE